MLAAALYPSLSYTNWGTFGASLGAVDKMNKGIDASLPKIVWMLWLQGWDRAPSVAHACRKSWEIRNPSWVVHCLDLQTLGHFLPNNIIEHILGTPKEPEALSDQIRLELLYRYGGVWADVTTICAVPLDDWLVDVMPHGFFAFARPGLDRMLSTWFLAAEKGAYIVERWRDASWEYWLGRGARDSYFWVHDLFSLIYKRDLGVRAFWDATPQVSAAHRFHFGPDNALLLAPPPEDIEEALRTPPVPVFKLTCKFSREPNAGSMFVRLCDFAAGSSETVRPSRRRLLVGWFGSFAGHGTIGDWRSLEAMVSHLVGMGHDVFHATADSVVICGAVRVDWRHFAPDACDAVIFVCGPILRHHSETNAFFERFATTELVGVGVSLLPEGHHNHYNPFRAVFARQGGTENFGDIAICAAKPAKQVLSERSKGEIVIGLALRGEQHEYGTSLCRWREAAAMFSALTDLLARYAPVRIVEIENHLVRAGRAPDEIEAQYVDCDLVLTTRFHGAIAALRQDVPLIALDQISGGAKVLPLLMGLGWSAVFGIDNVNALDILRAGLDLLHEPQIENLVASRGRHLRDANRTLAHVDKWLDVMTAR